MIFAGHGEAMIREHNARAWAVWHIAVLPKMKKFPKLEKLTYRAPRKPQTWQEQFAIMERWAAVQNSRIAGKGK